VARAALEGIAFQVADVIDAMRADSGVHLTELRVDGGAAANDLLMQFQADLLSVPVTRPHTLETTALGAAYLAGLATGVWSSLEDVASHWQAGPTFEPSPDRSKVEAMRARWNRAVERSRGWEREDF
jgi:glycerol kinase